MIIRQCLLIIVSLTIWCAGFADSTGALPMDYQAQAKQLQVLQKSNQYIKQSLTNIKAEKRQQLQAYRSQQFDAKLTAAAQLRYKQAQTSLQEANIELATLKQNLWTTKNTISQLQNSLWESSLQMSVDQNSTHQQLSQLRLQLTKSEKILAVQQRQVKIMEDNIAYTQQIVEETQDWLTQLTALSQQKVAKTQAQSLHKLQVQLQRNQQLWLNKVNELTEHLQRMNAQGLKVGPEHMQLSIELIAAHAETQLAQAKLILTRIQHEVDNFASLSDAQMPLYDIHKSTTNTQLFLDELHKSNALLQQRIDMVIKQQQILKLSLNEAIITHQQYDSYHQVTQKIIDSYQQQKVLTSQLIKKLNDYSQKLNQVKTRTVAQRQGLPSFDLLSIQLLMQKLARLPLMMFHGVQALAVQIYYSFFTAGVWLLMLLVVFEVLWVVAWYQLRVHLTDKIETIKASTQTEIIKLNFMFLRLFKRMIINIAVVGGVGIGLYIINLPIKALIFIIDVGLIWIVFKATIGMARLMLLETLSDSTGRDVKLYYGLKWSLIVGGIISLITLFCYQFPVPYELKEFFNRLFMLFLFVVAIVFIRSWTAVPKLLEPYIANKPLYIRRVIVLFSLLFPLSLLSNALIGLLGYVALAQAFGWHQAVFILVLVAYVLLRGLLVDGMEWLSGLFIRKIRNGWLWTQAVLQPMDRIARLLLFISAWVILFKFYGWNSKSYVVISLEKFMSYPLFKLTDATFTAWSFVELFIIISLLIWASKWSREFAYRWLFKNINDRGMRNSLSVFSQYTVIAVGIFVTLKVMGIGLTGLTVVFGGFAVAVGFGLRDLANNFMSGLFLLIERPVRAGDFVSIGGYDGEVTHIGARSMTVKTWDHMEVLVPNSEAFSKAFANWTLQDTVVRTVICVKVHRKDNPNQVKEVVLQVLGAMPAILSEPQPQILLKEISDSLIELEVRYYINLRDHSRALVRSEVLFQIWNRFNVYGIRPPYNQHDVYVRQVPSDEKDNMQR